MSSFLFQNAIQITLLGMNQYSLVVGDFQKQLHLTIAVFGYVSLHTSIPSRRIQVDIE